ncbi:unnamed protein product [Angiostrongylus costaricensis]|uniref:Secreted protein n=1 Tax=Angiostrongylus costaricensis TaxID=334426 RepID=A0A0R3PTR7_ANGCS|nr:unnamed protein product [Angiostrongylus costaricensis]
MFLFCVYLSDDDADDNNDDGDDDDDGDFDDDNDDGDDFRSLVVAFQLEVSHHIPSTLTVSSTTLLLVEIHELHRIPRFFELVLVPQNFICIIYTINNTYVGDARV